MTVPDEIPDELPVNKIWEVYGLIPPVVRGHLKFINAFFDDHATTGNVFYHEPHAHVIKESWSVDMKNSVAKHMDAYHRP